VFLNGGGILMILKGKNLLIFRRLIMNGMFILMMLYGCQNENSTTQNAQYPHIVNDILNAQNSLSSIPSLSRTYSLLTEDAAYKIQDLLAAELKKKYGPVAGYKIGYADSSALKKNGLECPAYGPFFKSRLVENGGVVPVKDFTKFSIECEVVFKIAKDIDKICSSIDELNPYIESIHLGFDMSESVFDSPSTTIDFIAGGAGSKYFMIGEGKNPDQVAIEDVMITVEFKDTVVYAGSSKNVLGNPWNVMLAVSNDMFKRGKLLKKGDLIFSGKAAPAFKVDLKNATGTYTGKASQFTPVVCNVK
jgi:2-keto-4-pentenoate hydratase